MEPTRSLWLQLDTLVFRAMNNSLLWGKTWQWIWAIANVRAFDLVGALAMLSLFVQQAPGLSRPKLYRLFSILLLTIITAVLAIQLGKGFPVDRHSPTLELENVNLLSQMVPQLPAKDTSTDCFPGDHGLVLLIIAGFITFFLPRSHAVLAWCFAVLFTLPRLMGGAHWLTDELVGALSIALLVFGLLFATPLHKKGVDGICTLLVGIDRRLRKA
jgi:membrane-associated phospholipid phosphatase